MKIQEIITSPPRDEYLDNYEKWFNNADVISKIRQLTLKKLQKSDEIKYGLFDDKDRLVGYLSLYHYKNDIWQVGLVQLAQAYKGLGYGTFLYDYAVMNDKLKLLSDESNTGGPHGSRELWQSLYLKHRYTIMGYDTDTDTMLPDVTPSDVYNNKTNIRWIALPPNETINEALTKLNQRLKDRYIVWYGPGTTTKEYFNY